MDPEGSVDLKQATQSRPGAMRWAHLIMPRESAASWQRAARYPWLMFILCNICSAINWVLIAVLFVVKVDHRALPMRIALYCGYALCVLASMANQGGCWKHGPDFGLVKPVQFGIIVLVYLATILFLAFATLLMPLRHLVFGGNIFAFLALLTLQQWVTMVTAITGAPMLLPFAPPFASAVCCRVCNCLPHNA